MVRAAEGLTEGCHWERHRGLCPWLREIEQEGWSLEHADHHAVHAAAHAAEVRDAAPAELRLVQSVAAENVPNNESAIARASDQLPPTPIPHHGSHWLAVEREVEVHGCVRVYVCVRARVRACVCVCAFNLVRTARQ